MHGVERRREHPAEGASAMPAGTGPGQSARPRRAAPAGAARRTRSEPAAGTSAEPGSRASRTPSSRARSAAPRTADAPPEHTPVGPVEVRRSRNRVRTVTAYRDGDRTIIAIPARFTRAQEREWVQRMVTRLERQERRRRPSDVQLAERAAGLSARYLAGRARPASVTWSSNQGRRWGSCTPLDGTIRISDRLQGMPGWVLDYVLLHELVHLLHAGHGPDFWAELDAYPRTDRARGFLEGVAYGHERARTGQQPTLGGDVDDESEDDPTGGDDDAGLDGTGLDEVDEVAADRPER
ncbi:hypothetical protein CCE01nite_00770 [Cellulomonas cellasea]|uniref:YgjP-like metallopeptidase domain-containing protein n=2 Tax=Cellulomonas cellasea TaxID=43670 RepID=A0A4Y3KTD0_9CELL|nr:hypothetical protein CCE01nite_00770 [Cellulomonas cellasea]